MSTKVTPLTASTVSLNALYLPLQIATSFTAAGRGDILRVVSAPAGNVPVGATQTFTLQTAARRRRDAGRRQVCNLCCYKWRNCLGSMAETRARRLRTGRALRLKPGSRAAAGPVTVTASSGNANAAMSFSAQSQADVLRVVSAPGDGAFVGSVAAPAFAVRVLSNDGVTAVAGRQVVLSVSGGSATLGACGAASCTPGDRCYGPGFKHGDARGGRGDRLVGGRWYGHAGRQLQRGQQGGCAETRERAGQRGVGGYRGCNCICGAGSNCRWGDSRCRTFCNCFGYSWFSWAGGVRRWPDLRAADRLERNRSELRDAPGCGDDRVACDRWSGDAGGFVYRGEQAGCAEARQCTRGWSVGGCAGCGHVCGSGVAGRRCDSGSRKVCNFFGYKWCGDAGSLRFRHELHVAG